MKLSLLAQVLTANYQGEDVDFSTYSTDTRSLKPGDMFVALTGETFDGHDFVDQAFQQGAVAALVQTSYKKQAKENQTLLFVDDTLKAYGLAAAYHATQCKSKKAAITGSCGKTSVKEMLFAILSEKGKVLATQGNFNNEVGVPRTLLSINQEHDFSVIEMGASKQGDIAYLSALVGADVVSVLNADRAHLQGFGSVDGVAKAKGEIFEGAKQGATAVLSLDEKYFSEWKVRAEQHGLRVISTSINNKTADIFLEESQFNGKGFILIVNVKGTVCEMLLPLLGEHNIKNALIAVGISYALGLRASEIAAGLQNVKAAKGRLNLFYLKNINDGTTKQAVVIDDSYNANPLSVKAAVDVLSQYSCPRILLLGDMAELGSEQEALHREVGTYIKEKNINVLITCGPLSQLSFTSFSGEGKAYIDQQLLLADIPLLLKKYPQGAFLVKGSRSAGMEKVTEALKKFGEAA